MPVTTPELTVAVVVLLLNQVPPGIASLNVTDEPTQTVEGPVIVDEPVTVTTVVAMQPPGIE
jgi:hypothetical protein